jgi:hypothetical protein
LVISGLLPIFVFAKQVKYISMAEKVKVLFKRLENGAYDFVSSATLSDGDKLWWSPAGVAFRIQEIDGLLVAVADPDPLTSETLSLELEIL